MSGYNPATTPAELARNLIRDFALLNRRGEAVLGAGTSTVVSVAGLRKGDMVFLQATDDIGASAQAHVSLVESGRFTITHLVSSDDSVLWWRVG